MNSDESHKGTMLAKYSSIEISLFIDYYAGFMKLLDQNEKEAMLCFNPLLEPIFDSQKGLKELRNNWVGHIQDDDKFEENMTDFIKRVDLPEDTGTYCYMIFAINVFVDVLRTIFAEDYNSLHDKVDKNDDENHPHRQNDVNWAHNKLRIRMADCKEKLLEKQKSSTNLADGLVNLLKEL